jgi:D-lactate dehydrogenase (quinone)
MKLTSSSIKPIVVGGSLVIFGYCCGVFSERYRPRRALPDGLPRSCTTGDIVHSESVVSEDSKKALHSQLEAIVGKENVVSSGRKLSSFITGARIGKGEALAVVQPKSLKEAVAALRACVAADVVVIPQGRNTGLTGGSVPRSDLCDRPTVIINSTRMNKVHPINNNQQMLCCGGVGIYDLSVLAKGLNRESHSVLGSIFLNPTVSAGVAFGSGGTQIRKGPAYTEQALWCRVNTDGQVEVVNTIEGISGSTEEELLDNVENGVIFGDAKKTHAASSDADRYRQHVCQIDDTVARCNADTTGIDPCRSEGKVFILASVHDTFAEPSRKVTYWITCSDMHTAQTLRTEVLLDNPEDLPVSCEYMDRDSIDVIDSSGRILCALLSLLGIGEKLSALWGVKLAVQSLPLPFFDILPDQILYTLNSFCPPALPPTLQRLSKEHDHHILVTLGEYGSGNLQRAEERLRAFVNKHPDAVVVHACNPDEINKSTFFRFAAAPAFRTYCVGRGLQGISIDYALRKNDFDIPYIDDALLSASSVKEGESRARKNVPVARMRYSHFGCNVVHEDLAFDRSADALECQMQIKKVIEMRGGKLPAEHGHGTEYVAPAETQRRWREMDPCNVLNAGVGGVGYDKKYKA